MGVLMLRSHHTKLNWLELVCNRCNDSCYDGCGDVYSRSPSLATPLTLIPTLFLTITLSRSHPSIVQIICCERVLTSVASALADPGTARAAGVANRRAFITRSWRLWSHTTPRDVSPTPEDDSTPVTAVDIIVLISACLETVALRCAK